MHDENDLEDDSRIIWPLIGRIIDAAGKSVPEKETTRSKRYNLVLTEEQWDEVNRIAGQANSPVSEFLRRSIDLGIALNQLYQSGLNAPETENAEILRIRIMEEPLTAQNLATIISSLTELHFKSWLIQQGRFSDLINYGQTRDLHFTKEANLVIGKFIRFSPALIELLLNPATLATAATASVTLAGALKIAIDNVGQTPLRYRATELENRKKELDIKIREQEAQQTQQIATQKAELDKQKTQLELAKQQLEIQEQLLELQKKSLEVERDRIEIALETASKMVDTLHPGVDTVTKGMLVQPLLPTLLQLSTAEGLELALPEPQKPEESIKKKEKQ